MKTLSAPALAALASGSICIVQLVALEFPAPIYLNTSTWDLTWQRRVNLCVFSNDFSGGGWAKQYVAVTPGFIFSGWAHPLSKVVESTDNSVHYILQDTGGIADGEAFTWSGVLADAGCKVYFEVVDKSNGFLYAYFNPATGIFEANSPSVSVAVTTLAAGLYRVSITCPGASGAGNPRISPFLHHDSGLAYAGDGTSGVYIGSVQVEVGTLATAYTPTTTTALNEPGVVYKGAYGLGSISAVSDKPGEISGLSLELAAGSPAIIALALDGADEVQGTVCTIRTAIIDTATYQILDAPIEWSGTLDTMSIGEDGNSAVVSVSAESKAVDLLRGTPSMYVDEEQTLINPTDRAFKYVVDQVDKPLIWPSRGYYQQ